MTVSKFIKAGSGLLIVIGIGAAIWAFRIREQIRQSSRDLAKKMAVATAATTHAQESQAAAQREAEELAAAAAARPVKAAAAKPKGPDWSKLLAAHPELQLAFEKAYSANRAHVYAPLYRRLQLSQEQIDRIGLLMAKDVMNSLDLTGAAQAQDLANDDPAIAKLKQAQKEELQDQEKAILGSDAFAAFQAFDNEMPVRNLVNGGSALAAGSGAGLTTEQEEQVTQLLVQTDAARQSDPTKRVTAGDVDWDAALGQAKSFLTSDQIEALRASAAFGPLGKLQSQYFADQKAAAK